MMTLKHFLADDPKNKERVNKLDFIGSLLQSYVKHRVFLKLGSRYGDYFQSYCNYFGRPLILKKSMHGMNNYGKIFDGDINNWLIDVAGF